MPLNYSFIDTNSNFQMFDIKQSFPPIRGCYCKFYIHPQNCRCKQFTQFTP